MDDLASRVREVEAELLALSGEIGGQKRWELLRLAMPAVNHLDLVRQALADPLARQQGDEESGGFEWPGRPPRWIDSGGDTGRYDPPGGDGGETWHPGRPRRA